MSTVVRPRRRSAPSVESLEKRQLMSLVVDLRVPGGAKSANVSSVGQTVNLEIWATVKGGNANPGDEGLQIAVGSLLSSNVNGGAANGTLKASLLAPFNAFGSTTGKQQDLDGDGDLDVGSNANNSATNFLFARGDSMKPGGSFKIGTATFTVTSLKSTTGQTNIGWRIRDWLSGGLWREDNNDTYKNGETGSYSGGSPVVIKRGGASTGGSISGTVFNDADKDNVFDAAESGIANVKVFIDADKDGVLDAGEKTSTTDGSGGYFFSGLAAGSHRVRQQTASGFKVTSPSVGYFDQTLATNQNVSNKNFANQATATTGGGSISGVVFGDNDKDGVLDATDTRLSGKKIYIDANKNGKLDAGEKTAISDSTGTYKFSGLAAGSYRVRRGDLPGGYKLSVPAAGFYDITLTTNQQVTGKHIGAVPATTPTTGGSIGGVVFSDNDKDGVLDTSDTRLGGKKIYIDANKNGKFDTGEKSVLSDSSGNYKFTGLAAGTYRIRRADLPGGYKLSVPSAGFYDIVLGSNQTVTGKNIGAVLA